MRKLLEELNRDKLLDFLEEYAQSDAKFANALNVRFRKPEYGEELRKIENKIDIALSGASDYRSHDSWGCISVDTGDIIEEIKQRTDQGHTQLAFAETELLYRKLLENFEYQGECKISDEAEHCLDIMSKIADNAVSAEDGEYIFEHCIELSQLEDGKDYGADYEDKLLAIAVKFVTLENRAELEQALAQFDSGWRGEAFKLIRLELVRKFDGEKAANDFVAENLCFPKIREIAFDKAVSRKDFTEGARLCLDALSTESRSYGISPWLYKLLTVYEMMENTEKMVETSQQILFAGDLEYYDKLKSLLMEQKIWDNSYLALLNECASKLHYQQYMDILSKESEYVLLLEQLKMHMDQIYRFGELLAKHYPSDICEIFVMQIKQEAEAAHKREMYRGVCHHILMFTKAEYQAEAADLINELKSAYRRKPAFVDELNQCRVC